MVIGELKSLRITLEAVDDGVLGYVYLHDIAPGQVARTEELVAEPLITADYDSQGLLLGIEFLHAEKADAKVMKRLAERLKCPELAGMDLTRMCQNRV